MEALLRSFLKSIVLTEEEGLNKGKEIRCIPDKNIVDFPPPPNGITLERVGIVGEGGDASKMLNIFRSELVNYLEAAGYEIIKNFQWGFMSFRKGDEFPRSVFITPMVLQYPELDGTFLFTLVGARTPMLQ